MRQNAELAEEVGEGGEGALIVLRERWRHKWGGGGGGGEV